MRTIFFPLLAGFAIGQLAYAWFIYMPRHESRARHEGYAAAVDSINNSPIHWDDRVRDTLRVVRTYGGNAIMIPPMTEREYIEIKARMAP